MTASEYLFAVVMTVLIVWSVAEMSVADALKGPRTVRRKLLIAANNFTICDHVAETSQSAAQIYCLHG
jgi:hypothetical protein